jgi:hypothetical protein
VVIPINGKTVYLEQYTIIATGSLKGIDPIFYTRKRKESIALISINSRIESYNYWTG